MILAPIMAVDNLKTTPKKRSPIKLIKSTFFLAFGAQQVGIFIKNMFPLA